MDDLIEQVRREQNEAKRKVVFADIQKLFIDDSPTIIAYHRPSVMAYRKHRARLRSRIPADGWTSERLGSRDLPQRLSERACRRPSRAGRMPSPVRARASPLAAMRRIVRRLNIRELPATLRPAASGAAVADALRRVGDDLFDHAAPAGRRRDDDHGTCRATPQDLATIRAQLGLDQPAIVQFGRWLGGVLQGDLGVSTRFQRPVVEILGPPLKNSLVLATAGHLVRRAARPGAGSLLRAATQLRAGLRHFLGFDLRRGHAGVRHRRPDDHRVQHLARMAPSLCRLRRRENAWPGGVGTDPARPVAVAS